jgi:hypothetical protein
VTLLNRLQAGQDFKIWIPGVSLNPYLTGLIADQLTLCSLWTGASWTIVLLALIGLICSQQAMTGQAYRRDRGEVHEDAISETASLLPPSYSDCESPPPCYSVAVRHQDKCPTYQEATEHP